MALPVDAEVGGAGRRGMRRGPAGRSRFTLVTRPGGLAHPLRPEAGTAAVLHRDAKDTAAGLAAEYPADGKA